jgi:hypothetical protein
MGIAISTLRVDPHHEHPVGKHPENDRGHVKRRRDSPTGELRVERHVQHAPRQANDESGRQHSMPLPEFGSSEPRPADLLQEGTVQPQHETATSRLAMSSAVMMAGRNACEVSENAARIAVSNSGAVSSASAYQRMPTRHRNNRDRRSRRPPLPCPALLAEAVAQRVEPRDRGLDHMHIPGEITTLSPSWWRITGCT